MRVITEYDKIIGKNIKDLRTALGLSKQHIGKHLSVSLQQLSKYENGVNKISAGKLVEISSIFNIPIDRFYLNTKIIDTESNKLYNLSLRVTNKILKLKDDATRKLILKLVDLIDTNTKLKIKSDEGK